MTCLVRPRHRWQTGPTSCVLNDELLVTDLNPGAYSVIVQQSKGLQASRCPVTHQYRKEGTGAGMAVVVLLESIFDFHGRPWRQCRRRNP